MAAADEEGQVVTGLTQGVVHGELQQVLYWPVQDNVLQVLLCRDLAYGPVVVLRLFSVCPG